MGYEHLNTTSKTESDEIIKSRVEELVPIPKLLIDDYIPFPDNEASDFDNPSFPRLPPKPLDAEIDVETDAGEEISVVMNDNDELECLD
nr:hypothetical protein [Tanacetum cinerariifolium]